ncbi:MAG: type IVB secretion system protein IcmG/DotF [Legionella sp.]
MADNDQNDDEYKFAELDSLDKESGEHYEQNSGSPTTPPKPKGGDGQKNVKRNALIAVGVIVFVMLMYKFIGGMFSVKTSVPPKENVNPAPVAEITPAPQPAITEVPPEPIQPTPAPIQQPTPTQQPAEVQENNSALQQKVSSIEATQQSVQTEVSSMNQQVGNVNNNVNSLATQITKLTQMIGDLTSQVARQSQEINVLMERTKPKPINRIVRHQQAGQQIIYYINAVIPGRAWLIGTNGSTLTVREGTKIAGYGVVKLIDSMDGLVLTSSGRVIRFSQEDS